MDRFRRAGTPTSIDFGALTGQLSSLVIDQLADLTTVAASDLQNIVGEITPALLAAVSSGDDLLVDELEAQLGALAEVQAIRAKKAFMRTVIGAANIAVGAASTALQMVGGSFLVADADEVPVADDFFLDHGDLEGDVA